MSTVEDPETTGEADLADLLPTGSIEPQVAEADPLDLSVPAGLLSSQTDLAIVFIHQHNGLQRRHLIVCHVDFVRSHPVPYLRL